MLVCFGAAWPASILKSYRSRSTKGKSIGFLLVILTGYLSGKINKLLYSNNFVLYLYMLNFFMVLCDVFLYLRNEKLEKKDVTR